MLSEREVVGLLYRADWTKLTLSGTVTGQDLTDSLSLVVVNMSGAPDDASSPGGFSAPDFSGEMTVEVAPGSRYRQATASGSRIRGCDGARTWEWLGELPPGVRVKVSDRPQPPVPALLDPAWLLSGHRLAIDDGAVACGRYGIRVVATPSRRERLSRDAGATEMSMGAPRHGEYRRVVAIVDAELGILLHCACETDEDEAEVTEFTRLSAGVAAASSPVVFTAPRGSLLSGKPGAAGTDFARTLAGPLGGIGWEAAKLAGGLAAGGLGAAVRFAPSRRANPFGQATAEASDPDAVMPTGDPLPEAAPGWAGGRPGTDPGWPEAGDELLHLLQRGGAAPAPFRGTLHDWTDGRSVLAAVPESARRAGLGGVGFLVDSLQEKAAGIPAMHTVHEVRFGGQARYRVDAAGPSADRGKNGRPKVQPQTVAGDGERFWRVYQDRVVTGPERVLSELPGEVAAMADGSWLLGCWLFGGAPAEVDGRRGYLVAAVRRAGAGKAGFWSSADGSSLPAMAVVDAETGRLLRLTRYLGSRVTRVLELRSVAPAGTDGFGFTPPPGLRVEER
jgi:hypothetical protein